MSGHDWKPDTFGDMVCRKCGILRAPGRDREKFACGVDATFENQDDECSRTRSLVEGVKHDEGKLEWSLVPRAFEHVVRVLMYGAGEYAPYNWRKVKHWRKRYYNAARRHLEDWRHGERLDPESGLPHLAHAICCVLFMLALDEGDD